MACCEDAPAFACLGFLSIFKIDAGWEDAETERRKSVRLKQAKEKQTEGNACKNKRETNLTGRLQIDKWILDLKIEY